MKRIILITIFIITINISSFSQWNCISADFSYTCDALSNVDGGIKTGTGFLGMIKIDIDINTEKAGLWKGGQLFITGINTHGFEPSKELIGDFHTVSNIEAGDNTFIHELWYKQQLGNTYIKLGITDLNTDFAVSEFGSFFLNSSFGLPSVISGNIPVSTFPITNIGGIFHWQIDNDFAIQTSIHKGISGNIEENKSSHYFREGDGWTSFTEISMNRSIIKGMKGIYKLGMYYHKHPNESEEHNGNYGIYLIGDQQIYRDRKGGNISAFTQIGMCPKKLNTNDMYFGLGIHYEGINRQRPEDELGVAIALANFCSQTIKTETAIEVSYKMPLHKHLCIQPTLQYVINPGNSNQAINNALVGIFRIVIE